MADLKVAGQTTVRKLKEEFKKNFGATLRVYESETQKKFADEKATMASLRKGDKKGGEFSVGGNTQVGNFEKKMYDVFGITVQVANADDTKLAKNDITLVAAGK